MKKILLVVLNILLVIILIVIMKSGLKIGPFQILSFQGIQNLNSELDQKIKEAKNYESNYSQVVNTLNSDIAKLASAKKDYLDLVTISSESEIQQATQTKNYTIEYLWGKVGNYATEEGVKIKMDIASSSMGNSSGYRNLNFTVNGNYLAMTNFIYKLENDSDLEFTIDTFNMTSGQCSFVVKDVIIKQEKAENLMGVNAQTTEVSSGVKSDASSNASVTGTVNTGAKVDASAITNSNKQLEELSK